MDYFTSDLHIGHRNSIRRFRTQFSTIEEMNQMIVDNINKRVAESDTLYILGDVCLCSKTMCFDTLEQIHCKNLILVVGNHDSFVYKHSRASGLFAEVHHGIREIKKDGVDVVLCHYPIIEWNRKTYGAYHLHGHSHGNLHIPGQRMLDVGIDNNERFEPYSWDEIVQYMESIELDLSGQYGHHTPKGVK